MEHYKISKLLNDLIVFKFVTKKLVKVNDLSGGQYSVNKNIRSDLCVYSDAYIVIKGSNSVTDTTVNNRRNKQLAFKNNAPFRSFISKVNNTLVDNTEDLDIVTLMCNLLEYSDNYFMTLESLSNYCKR